MKSQALPHPSGKLTSEIKGVWILQTREDWTPQGERRIDPVLGPDPVGILAYGGNRFSAQFMKRDRTETEEFFSYAGSNNTVATGGYDAYFGTYQVDEETGEVLHTLEGSIHQANAGISVSRDIRVTNDKLIIQLKTTTAGGEAITRTLTWIRDH